jgi:hypothetical protein
VEEVGKSEFGKKSKEFTEELSKTAGKAAETIGSAGEHLAKSQPMKKVAQVLHNTQVSVLVMGNRKYFIIDYRI